MLFIFRFLIAYCAAIVCNTIVWFFATIVVNWIKMNVIPLRSVNMI